MYFETYARVRVKAPELGLLYNVLCLISFASILYSVFMSHQHLEMEPVSFGVASFRLRNHDDDAVGLSGLPHANERPPYCDGTPCQVWDAKEAIQADNGKASVVTFVRDTLEKRVNCASRWSNDGCEDMEFVKVARSAFAIRDVEDYELVIEHSFEARQVFGSSISGKRIPGTLVCFNGSTFPFRRHVVLHALLQCAGVSSLDSPSDEVFRQGSTRSSLRQRGIVLHVSIEYTNLAGSWLVPGQPEFFVRVQRMEQVGHVVTTVAPTPGTFTRLDGTAVAAAFPGLDAAVLAELQDPSLEYRAVRKTASVHLALEQGGKMAKLTVGSVLASLVTVTALFNMPFLVVDFVMFWLNYVDVAEEEGTAQSPSKPQRHHEYAVVAVARGLRLLRSLVEPAPSPAPAPTDATPTAKRKAE